MRIKTLIATALIAAIAIIAPTSTSAAAPKISRDKISSTVSKTSYLNALKLFQAGKPLSATDGVAVYYGSAMQPGFNSAKKYTDIEATYSSGATDKAFKMIQQALESDPTNLSLLFKAYASAAVSKDPAINANAPIMKQRILSLCDAIMDSASGVDVSAPFVVVRPSDIEEFLYKYIQPDEVMGKATVSGMTAYKVKYADHTDPIIFYFTTF